jgi:hypothetical protein
MAMATGVAKPALAQINSLSFKGFNYVYYYNGGYANADSLSALAGTGANAAALAFEYGIDVKNSAVYVFQYRMRVLRCTEASRQSAASGSTTAAPSH